MLRQSLETRADALEIIDFVEDRFKAQGHIACREELKVWENLRCHQLQRSSFANDSDKQPEELGNENYSCLFGLVRIDL